MILFHLHKHGGNITTEELVNEVAAAEYDTDVESLTKKQRKRVYVSLYQTHLPRLSENGLVEYRRDEGTAQLTKQAERIDSYFAPHKSRTYPWHKYYISCSILSGIVLLLQLLGFPGISRVSATITGGGVAVAFGVIGVVQYVLAGQTKQNMPRALYENSF